jgi:hypothetical protein
VFAGVLRRADGCIYCCDEACANQPTPVPELDELGRRVFVIGAGGGGVLVVEGKRGLSGLPPASSLDPVPPSNRPDLWIQSTQNLGNGSPLVCDKSPPIVGGVPGRQPPDFDFDFGDSTVNDALVDFACRFQYFPPGQPCTFNGPGLDATLVIPGAEAQFCDFISAAARFLPGESVVSVVLRDASGNVGPTKQIVVRVPTPTPTP